KMDDDNSQAEGERPQREQTLDRIRSILEEIDRQITQLGADRDAALKYKELNGRLTTAKAQLAYKNRELIERQIVGTKEQIAKHEADKAKLEGQKAELRKLLDAAVARLSELEQEMADRGGEEAKQLKEKLNGIVLEGDRTREAMGRLESEISQIEESRKQYQVEFDDTDWQLKELRSSTKESGKSLQKLQQEFHEKRAEEAKLAKE